MPIIEKIITVIWGAASGNFYIQLLISFICMLSCLHGAATGWKQRDVIMMKLALAFSTVKHFALYGLLLWIGDFCIRWIHEEFWRLDYDHMTSSLLFYIFMTIGAVVSVALGYHKVPKFWVLSHDKWS